MQVLSNRIKIVIKPSFFVLVAVAGVLLPLPLILAWSIAAMVHELSHYLVLLLCNIPIYRIQFNLFGIRLETGPMDIKTDLVCSLAGPIAGFLLFLFHPIIPLIACCAVIQSFINILPMEGRDGGRAMRCALDYFFGPEKGCLIARTVDRVVRLALVLLSVVLFFCSKLILFLVFAVFLLILIRKIPCKADRQIVQCRQLIPKR